MNEATKNRKEITDGIIRKIAIKFNQFFWEYQQHLKNPQGDNIEIIESIMDMDYGKWLFGEMKALAAQTTEGMPEALDIPEFRRFAEYFGAVPIQEDGEERTRGYEDRLTPIILPGEEIYFESG